MDTNTTEEIFVQARGSTTDSIFASGPQPEDLLMTLDHKDLFASNHEDYFKQHQEFLNHEPFLIPALKDTYYEDRLLTTIPRDDMSYHNPTLCGLGDHHLDSMINPIFLSSPFHQGEPSLENDRNNKTVNQQEEQKSDSAEERSDRDSHNTVPPGTLVRCSGGGGERIIGKLRLHREVYENPLRVHRQIRKVIVDQLDASAEPVEEPLDGNARRETLRWKPLSIYSAYHAIKGADSERHSFNSCFGKINMRLKRAWNRRPNKRSKKKQNAIAYMTPI